jgi:DNA segregation ATPase FtsK/SpoIIIE-like protein
VNFEAVADKLYALPRGEFTAARNVAVKQAREQGDRELADQIAALRRPSSAAWVANLLAREQPEEIRALVELGDGLREAQRRLQGDELRRLSAQRHQLVHGLVQQAQALARAAGHPASESVTRELSDTFTAAVNSTAAAQALAGGRLTSALNPADAATELFAAAATVTPGVHDDARPEGRNEQRRQDLENVRQEAIQADAARDAAQRALTAADQAAQDAATTLQELRARVDAAEHTEHETRRRAQSARRDFESADRTARDAWRRVHDLERQLAQHGNG